MHGGSDDGAGDEKNREDRRETSNGEEGVQGSHHTHSHVSTRTLHPQEQALRSARSGMLILILRKS